MSSMRTIMACVAALAALGTGIGMWNTVAPGEERKREILKNLPESSPARMEESRKRNALMMQVLKEAAETDDNIARGFGSRK
ncbi:ubiquinol-cytochrome-c reductase complex assembly factor 3 [Colossoma macropomum]|uniref:ubiquinol-cytochrome-c reductase complex assembly factor 3 n=1 Tax=Colossoma macropomum TaxID=42526 RepID=UPI0018651F05|nr:ubiquinol-cytochrome-c reductase complex assembly factor 3 [Colossoma macropomum]